MRRRKNDTYDATGRTGKEAAVIRSFWCDYTMEQVKQMSQEELDKSISDSLDRYAAERMKMDKRWDWPIPQGWSLIKRNKKSLDKKDKNII